MTPRETLDIAGLTSWATLLFGWNRGWVCRQDVISYAVRMLQTGHDATPELSEVAAGEILDDDELRELVIYLAEKEEREANRNIATLNDKWRLAHLLSIASNTASPEEKISALQHVYAEFGYPTDMHSCSIYAQDNVDPLVAMRDVIHRLGKKLGAAITV